MEQSMSAEYDHSAEFIRDIEPLFNAIHKACVAMDLPCVLSVCYGNRKKDDGNVATFAHAVNICGSDRTPPSFCIADMAIADSPVKAAMAVIIGGIGRNVTEVTDPSENAPKH